MDWGTVIISGVTAFLSAGAGAIAGGWLAKTAAIKGAEKAAEINYYMEQEKQIICLQKKLIELQDGIITWKRISEGVMSGYEDKSIPEKAYKEARVSTQKLHELGKEIYAESLFFTESNDENNKFIDELKLFFRAVEPECYDCFKDQIDKQEGISVKQYLEILDKVPTLNKETEKGSLDMFLKIILELTNLKRKNQEKFGFKNN